MENHDTLPANADVNSNKKHVCMTRAETEFPSLRKFFDVLRWCRLVLTSITVEPVVFLHTLATSVSKVATSNMTKDRICSLYFEYSGEQCGAYGSGANKTVDITVREEWVAFGIYSTLVHTIPSLCVSLFLGSWSDLFGRRLPLIWNYMCLVASLTISLVLFWYPSLPLWMLLLPTVVSSIAGGLLMSVYGYIADVSETGSARTLRIATADVATSLASTVGNYISSVLLMTTASNGNGSSFWLSLGFALLGLIYVLIFIKTTQTAQPPTVLDDDASESSTTKTTSTGSVTSVWQKIRALGRIRLIIESFRCAFKRRKGHTRTVLWMLIAIMTILLFSSNFENKIWLPFITGAPLHWTTAYQAKIWSYFGIPEMIVLSVGTWLLRRALKVDDVGLMLVGTICLMTSNFVSSIAQQTYMMCISYAIDLPGGMSMIALRSIMSGLVPRSEQGKVFSCVSVLESLVPLLAAVAASKTFAASIEWWPGLYAAVSAGFEGTTLVILVIADRFMLADKVAARKDELNSFVNMQQLA